MKYVLRVVDLSGRGYKSLHEYDSAQEREDDLRKILAYEIEEDEDENFFDDLVASLESGSVVRVGATEYEFLQS